MSEEEKTRKETIGFSMTTWLILERPPTLPVRTLRNKAARS